MKKMVQRIKAGADSLRKMGLESDAVELELQAEKMLTEMEEWATQRYAGLLNKAVNAILVYSTAGGPFYDSDSPRRSWEGFYNDHGVSPYTPSTSTSYEPQQHESYGEYAPPEGEADYPTEIHNPYPPLSDEWSKVARENIQRHYYAN